MVPKRIKYARMHLTRRGHVALLARPVFRRSYLSTDSNCLPRPFSVSRAALQARPSKRIKMMAQPKSVQRKFDRASASQSRVSLQYPRAQGEILMLSPETAKRLFDLSLPKKSALLYARRLHHASNLHPGMLANVNSLLRGIRKSRYQKYRIICNSLQQRAAAREEKIRRKLRRALAKPGDWERHNRVLEKLAAPKRLPKLPGLSSQLGRKRKSAGPYDSARLEQLAQPVRRSTGRRRDPFSVARSAIIGAVSEYVLKLAEREHPRREPRYRIPGYVPRGALKAEASERVLELAKPAVRPPGLQTDLKEDAFSVPPLALKAMCRPRIKVLAQPKNRGRIAKVR